MYENVYPASGEDGKVKQVHTICIYARKKQITVFRNENKIGRKDTSLYLHAERQSKVGKFLKLSIHLVVPYLLKKQ